jgi:hypothetical protein
MYFLPRWIIRAFDGHEFVHIMLCGNLFICKWVVRLFGLLMG